MSASASSKQWSLSSLSSPHTYALLLLNQPPLDKLYLKSLWNNAALKVAVDGGANHAFHLRQELEQPDMVTGDFDSITEDARQWADSMESCVVINTPDQDATDFTKCLKEVATVIKEKRHKSVEKVLAFCECSGRLDQVMANIETLYHAVNIINLNVNIVSSSNVAFLLQPGLHRIAVDQAQRAQGHVGLIPVGQPASRVSTQGLEWDLKEDKLAFGSLVSTSNKVVADFVDIETDANLLFTIETKLPTHL